MKVFFEFVKKENIILFFILTIGLFLRLYNLGKPDFWNDEACSIVFSKNLGYIFCDMHPPFYYALLKFWIFIAGETEFRIRLLSAIFSIVTVFFIFKLGQKMFNKNIGLIGAFILSVSPIHLWYAQEARSYVLITFLVTLCVYVFALIVYENRKDLHSVFAILLLLCLYTEYISFFILAATGVVFIFKQPRFFLKEWILSWIAALAGFLAWAPVFWIQFTNVVRDFWIEKVSQNTLINTLQNFNLGYESGYHISNIAVFLFLFLAGIFLSKKQERIKVTMLASMIAVPFAALFIMSATRPVYLDRQLLPVTVFYYLLIAKGIESFKNPLKILPLALVLSMLFLSVPGYYKAVNSNKKSFKPLVDYIRQGLKEDDVLCITTGSAVTTVPYYLSKCSKIMPEIYLLHAKKGDSQRLHVSDLKVKKWKGEYWINGVRDLAQDESSHIWVVSGSWKRDGYLDINSSEVCNWFQSKTGLLVKKAFDGLFLEARSIKR